MQRDIPGQGRIKGKVIFSPTPDGCLEYGEKGLFYMDRGAVLETERKYIYALERDKIAIHYADPERHDEVLHELVFTDAGTAHHTHLCGSDRYALDFLVRSRQEIEMIYRVCGEKKDYTMTSRLVKAVSDRVERETGIYSRNRQRA